MYIIYDVLLYWLYVSFRDWTTDKWFKEGRFYFFFLFFFHPYIHPVCSLSSSQYSASSPFPHWLLLSPFPLRTKQASQGYQLGMTYRDAIKLDINPPIKAGQATQKEQKTFQEEAKRVETAPTPSCYGFHKHLKLNNHDMYAEHLGKTHIGSVVAASVRVSHYRA